MIGPRLAAVPAWRDWRLASSSRPIIVGPWRSEIGFECLYWLPWLAAWRAKYQIAKDRLIVVARGGTGAWYDAAHVVDLLDYFPPDKLRKAMLADQQRTGSVKQYDVAAWESKCISLIADDLGVRRYHWLHPSAMYHALRPWWEGSMGQREVLERLRFDDALPVVAPPLDLPLPERFVAVRFYHRHTWPMTEEIIAWTAELLDAIGKRIPLVSLNCGLYADDHIDFPWRDLHIQTLAGHVTPSNNLAVQSAVLAKAQAFVGTYGGIMQLAVRYRRPSVGFYAKFEGTAIAHKQLTEWLALNQRTPCFIGRPEDALVIADVMGPALIAHAP